MTSVSAMVLEPDVAGEEKRSKLAGFRTSEWWCNPMASKMQGGRGTDGEGIAASFTFHLIDESTPDLRQGLPSSGTLVF